MKLLTTISLGIAYSTLTSTATVTEEAKSVDQLIVQLSSKTYKEREIASYKLWKLGEKSLSHLKNILGSSDPEQDVRAEILIRNIEAGVLPSTDKKVIKAIDRYSSTLSMSEKQQTLDELVKLGAFKQVLYLLHGEEDARTREKLGQSREMRGVASRAAKQALSDGDIEEAIQLLRIAPKNEDNYRALAHILKHLDKLDAEIDATKKLLPVKAAQEWLLAQLRTSGDLKQAKIWAKKTKNEQALATFSVLDGNPIPLLEYFKSRSSNTNHTIVLNLLKRLHSQNDPADIHEVIAELATQVDGEADERRNLEYITRVALLMGDRAVGEKLLKRYSKAHALAYFRAQGYPEKELELLSTPNPVTQAEEFEAWMSKEIERELDTDLGLLAEKSSAIEDLAHFYFNRGERELSLGILKPLLKSLLDDGNDRWFKIVGELPLYGMGEFVAQLASERGNEDDTYLRLSREIFGNVGEMDFIWKQVEELHGNASDLEHFLSVLEVMGIRPSDKSNKKSTLSQMEDLVESTKGEARVDLLVSLAYAAESRNDFEMMLRHYKELCKDRELAEKRKFYVKYQRAAEVIFDWQEIVASYDLKPESYINEPTRLTRYAIAKRKLGEKELSDTLLKQAHLGTLGGTHELNALATVLHECGARKEAKAIWLEHIACLDVGSVEFYYALNYINHQSGFAIEERNWKLASSFSLAEMTFLVQPRFQLSRYYISLRSGYTSNYVTGMYLLEQGDEAGALEMLEYAHKTLTGDGTLADNFFPSLINSPLKKDVEKWFEASWNHMEKGIEAYPNDHNARNTAAWLGARTGKRLDDSLKHAKSALLSQPVQPAYLDTLAEIHFSKRDRASAVKQSNKSLEYIKSGAYAYIKNASSSANMFSELTHQNTRFKNETFPMR